MDLRRAVITLALLGTASTAHAIPLVQSVSFATPQAPAPAPSFSPLLPFDLFDPGLGTLNGVEVSMTGSVLLTLIAPPFLVGPGGTPVPYGVSGMIEQGLVGLGDVDVGIDVPRPTLSFSQSTSGSGDTFLAVAVFDYLWTYSAASDLAGFTPIAASIVTGGSLPLGTVEPVLAFGRRDDFQSPLPGPFPGFLQTSLEPSFLASTGAQPTLLHSSSGSIRITYDYTPVPVSSPGAWTLLAGGLVVLAIVRRRPRAARR